MTMANRAFLNRFSDEEDRLLAARAADAVLLAQRRRTPQFLPFLDLASQRVAEEALAAVGCGRYALFGGFPDAERRMLGIGFEEPPTPADFPLTCLRAETAGFCTLSHRDYLGTVMGLGITRDKVGDIVADAKGAYLFIAEELADFAAGQLTRIGGAGARTVRLESLPALDGAALFVPREGVIASARMDCVVGELAHLARSRASEVILAGAVKHMGKICKDRTKTVAEGDVITIRGVGKFRIRDLSGRTKKDHIVLKAEQYR